jgi:hypothetical protein
MTCGLGAEARHRLWIRRGCDVIRGVDFEYDFCGTNSSTRARGAGERDA